MYDVQFSDVYGTVDDQLKAVKVFKKVLKRRNICLEILDKQRNTHQTDGPDVPV